MKGKKTEFANSPCPIARTLGIIGDWWSLLIIRDALGGPQRFGELQRNLGMAKNILSTRLRKLVDAEILETAPVVEGSSFSEYRLTEKGEQLYLVLAALWQWGERYVSVPAQRSLQVVDRKNLQPVAPLELRSLDGRHLGARDFTARMVDEA
jgi:DNA-binding HxlR family transcriptional regulator